MGSRMHLLITAPLLGVDSFVVSAALGPMFKPSGPGWRMAVAFGACDAIAFVIGSAFCGAAWIGQVTGPTLPAAVLAYGLYVLAAARWSSHRVSTRPVYLLPVLMSFDNLVDSLLAGPPGGGVFGQALLLGFASGALSLLGLVAGRLLFAKLARPGPASSGAALIAVSLLLLAS
jgi:putative Mn2+ efflux pump MntP